VPAPSKPRSDITVAPSSCYSLQWLRVRLVFSILGASTRAAACLNATQPRLSAAATVHRLYPMVDGLPHSHEWRWLWQGIARRDTARYVIHTTVAATAITAAASTACVQQPQLLVNPHALY
jgi:hypothetical protein